MIKFHFNKAYNYVKGKSVVELMFEFLAFGILLPMAVSGIAFMIFAMLTGQVDFNNVSFGIYG